MKKCKILCICLILAFSCLPFTTAKAAYNMILDELEPRSEIVLLQSLEDDTVIFDKNAHQHTPPASLTKLVTAILTLENVDDLNAMVAVPQSVLDSLANTGSSNAGLKAGEELSVADLLRCMLIPSANEAAGTLAYYVSGGNIEGFVEKMNVFAHRLGCADTNFMTPHGLDADGQYTCAADVAKIMKYALTCAQSELFTEIISTERYTLPASNMHEKPRVIRNTNFLLNSGYSDYYCKYVIGGKTGSTSKAGKCVAAIAKNGGYSYLAVIMNAPHDDIDGDAAMLPTSDISMCHNPLKTNPDAYQVIIVGRGDSETELKGRIWGKVEENSQYSQDNAWTSYGDYDGNKYPAPALVSMQAIAYDEGFVLFGGNGIGETGYREYSTFYKSLDGGLSWRTDNGMTLPNEFICTNDVMAMTVDSDNCIWIVCGASGQVWFRSWKR